MSSVFADWPPKVRAAFEVYYAAEGRSLDAVSRQAGMPSLRTLKRMSADYRWQEEVERRLTAEAAAAERAAIDRRNKIRSNVESGLARISQDFAYEANGVCSRCKGAKQVVTEYHPDGSARATGLCPACGGTGATYPLEIMRKYGGAFQRMYKQLGEVWLTGQERPADEQGGISEDEYQRLQQDMLKRAGISQFLDGTDEEIL